MVEIFRIIWKSRYFRFAALLAIASITLIAFGSYSPKDPSFNSYSLIFPSNILGYFGAYYGDFLVQFFGFLTYIFIATLIIWSFEILKNTEVQNFYSRLFSLIIGMIFLNYFLFIFFPERSGYLSYFFNNYLHENFYKNEKYLALIALLFSKLLISYSAISSIKKLKSFFDFGFIFQFFAKKKSPHAEYSDNFFEKKFQEENEITEDSKSIFGIKNFTEKKAKDKKIINKKSDSNFILPPNELLNSQKDDKVKLASRQELEEYAEELLKVLNDFGVKGQIIDINQGPVVTLFEFEPAAGTKSSRVIGLSDDIARTLCAISARIAVIPGRNVLGIELPNKTRQFFRLRELLESDAYNSQNILLPIVLGKDLAGKACVVDLARMPHLLVAGTTGSGKSVAINAMIISLLYRHTPDECRFIMIDPKMLELSIYDNIPHLLTPVVTEPGKAVVALKWAVKEMENRYRLMSNVGVRNIGNYNSKIEEAIKSGQELKRSVQTGFDPETGKAIYESLPIEMKKLPFIVVIVDEMADLMLVAGKDIESSIQRLAQMARAAGIHIIMATQRPSVDVITGVIKANFPSRISFKVTSKIDSRTILGEQGAEQLLGMGDMLYMGNASRIIRVHGPFVDDLEVEKISDFLKNQATPEYISSVTESDDEEENFDIDENSTDDDSLYRKAVQIVIRDKKPSTSYVQRSLRIGYNRAAILIERMEKEGVVSAPNHSGKREILIED